MCCCCCRRLGTLELGGEQQGAAAAAAAATAATAGGDEDDADLAARLTEIYERMGELGGPSAESRASKILHGLGFTEVMQVWGLHRY